MRYLLPDPEIPVELAAAYPWPELRDPDRSWTRVAMLRALDGGVAGADGRSRSISSAADRAVLGEIRRLADAVVVGAQTVRAEPYGPLRSTPDTAAERSALGLAQAPALVVVSASLDLPWPEPMFGGSAVRPVVVTVEGTDPAALATARGHADIVVLPGRRVGPAALVAALRARGLRRLVCEGGPGLLAAFAAADTVDEVDLTVSPMLATLGTAPGPAPTNEASRFRLAQLIEADAFLFARYLRHGPSAAVA